MMKLTALVLALMASSAFALPLGSFDALALKSKTNLPKGFDFEAIVKLSNCSGSFIKFDGAPETNKALVLTNGHCINAPAGGFLKADEVLVDYPVKVTLGIYSKSQKLVRLQTTRFVYATMTKTDMAIYELGLTYKEIKDLYDIEPLTLAKKITSIPTEVQIISGYWDRGYDCTLEALIPKMKEDVYVWQESVRYNEHCDTIPGTSGSPIIERNTRTVVAINNTGNDKGEKCTMNNPCEIGTDGTITVRKGFSYGQQTYEVYSCLNKDFSLNLAKRGCKLLKPKKI
jgi:V8-like Glu-specific endopeptidase